MQLLPQNKYFQKWIQLAINAHLFWLKLSAKFQCFAFDHKYKKRKVLLHQRNNAL